MTPAGKHLHTLLAGLLLVGCASPRSEETGASSERADAGRGSDGRQVGEAGALGALGDSDSDSGSGGGGSITDAELPRGSEPMCGPGQHDCAGRCVDDSAPASCGRQCEPCPTVAGGTATCDGNRCGVSCPPGQKVCLDRCMDALAVCDGTCAPGQHACDGLCVDRRSAQSCGSSCTPCPPVPSGQPSCDGERCGFICNPGFHDCGGRCLASNDLGSCGDRCTPCEAPPGGQASCNNGQCSWSCPGGRKCGNACVSASDPCNGGCGSGYTACNGTCIPSGLVAAEACNGADDDCDGAIDEGCPVDGAALRTGDVGPASLAFGVPNLPRQMPFSHECPAGQAAIGFTGNAGGGIDRLGVRCGKLQVQEDRSQKPFRYQVAVSPGAELAPRGGGGGVPNVIDQALRCPLGQIVAGVSGWNEAPAICPADYCVAPRKGDGCRSLRGLALHCARLELAGRPGSFAVVQAGSLTMTGRVAGPGMMEKEVRYFCPTGEVVAQVTGSLGPWPYNCPLTVVNGMQVSCSRITVPVR